MPTPSVRDPLLDRPRPSEFINPDVIADRLWDRIAPLPIPHTFEEKGPILHEIFFAIREELGACYAMIGLRDKPDPIENLPTALEAHKVTHQTGMKATQESLEEVVSETGEFAGPMIKNLCDHFHVEREDVDLCSTHLVHRNLGVGLLLLARIRSQSGPVTETDRNVIAALHDRLAARLAQWYDASLPRES